jgi:multidrug efflux pump subunit AcrA (membrane-fusion protein)
VAAAEAELEQARALLAQTELRAPSRGVVLRRMIEVGEQVVTTMPKVALTLADLDRAHVRAEIDEGDVGRVRVGQPGWVTAEAYGERRLPGRVVSLQRELGRKSVRLDDPHARADTRVLEVVFALDQPEALPLGLRMDMHLDTRDRSQVVKVPLAAVRRATPRAESAEVTVVTARGTSARRVRLGTDDGRQVEVLEGLAPGESVALP